MTRRIDRSNDVRLLEGHAPRARPTTARWRENGGNGSERAAGDDRSSQAAQRSQSAGDTSSSHPLDALVEGIATGCQEAYEHLYEHTADRLLGFALRLLHDHQEAEDAVQQAFLELARTPSPPTEGRSLEAWLFTSVRFTCGDVFRRRLRRPEVPYDTFPDVQREDVYELGLDPEIEVALASLTPQQRVILHLKHVEGFNGHQIAEIVGSNRVAVYAAAGRAERRLKTLLESGRARPRGGGDG